MRLFTLEEWGFINVAKLVELEISLYYQYIGDDIVTVTMLPL